MMGYRVLGASTPLNPGCLIPQPIIRRVGLNRQVMLYRRSNTSGVTCWGQQKDLPINKEGITLEALRSVEKIGVFHIPSLLWAG